ncbi:hypothetical protein BK130_01870 [Viridibacillus sp. FSL H8-0123]|uniref:Uncharacterized protein n=1 Tax=Viridibacillus arenosi FSL R5-213 TaxID=1227360 RepID=W4ERE4_9BACL|nr:hypothetical protein C176_16327 [Viridibacillus arenosi FSL R5-213]OMC85539.1 hypothetical protein BK130_01870 [Viridibacillus sp. FSL H8-0123]OMC92346.1 hypothetical protein BK137_04670 [Viridibacillus arenosi]
MLIFSNHHFPNFKRFFYITCVVDWSVATKRLSARPWKASTVVEINSLIYFSKEKKNVDKLEFLRVCLQSEMYLLFMTILFH